MKKQMIRFPDIESYRHVRENVDRAAEFCGMDENDQPIINPDNPRPHITFKGTVKLHGTNAAACWNGEELWAQSRTSIITPLKDNAGFAQFVEGGRELLTTLMENIKETYNVADDRTIAVYGEWCGKGIQKGVAVNALDKMFVIFKIKIASPAVEEENIWLNYSELITHSEVLMSDLADKRIFFIEQFSTYDIKIDFNDPEASSDELTRLTTQVENQCPVGAHFGAEGIGEGIVWSGTHFSYDEETDSSKVGQSYIFKVKGEKHQVAGKNKSKKNLAPADIEKLANIAEFVEYAVTENRLEQGIQEVFTTQNVPITNKGIGAYLKWVQGDVIKEEIDTLVKNGLEVKDVNGAISKKAVTWFRAKYI